MKFIASTLLLFPAFSWGKCGDDIPNYLIEIDIQSCKTIELENERGTYSAIKGKVVESVQLPLSNDFKAEYAIAKSEVSILMSTHATKSCENFGHDILSKYPITLLVRKMCCDAGQPYCKEAKYWGYDLPFLPTGSNGYKSDLNFDFNGNPDAKKYHQQQELLRKISEKDEHESKPAT